MTSIVGIDIGGTFTDVVHVDEATGELTVDKVPTTTGTLQDGLRDGLDRLRTTHQLDLAETTTVVHGTTVATNALLEDRLPRTALVVTEGFADVLEIGTMVRPDLYRLDAERRRPVVDRADVVEVRERVGANGAIVTQLDDSEVERVIRQVRGLDVEAVAICLLFSFADGRHEQRLAAAVAAARPDVAVLTSSEADPEPREFLRANTTSLSGSLSVLVRRYIDEVQGVLQATVPRAQLLIMQSSGDLMPAAEVGRNSHRMVLSGPAGGVIAAQHLASGDQPNLITVDVGGTSSDLCLIADGRAVIDIEPAPMEQNPIRAASLQIRAVGAGGGSVAFVDESGVLRVGPRSAGAVPGPVCYLRGGTEPTVTDAQLVLGRLSPGGLLGGDMKLDVDAARGAIDEQVARPLGVAWDVAAAAIVEVAVASMVRGLRTVSVDAGYDPTDFTLVAYGGGGPLHACDLAAAAQIRTILVPEASSAYSALGLLMADVRRTFSDGRPRLAAATSADDLAAALAALRERAESEQDAHRDEWRFEQFADLRYVGQRGAIRVPLPPVPFPADLVEQVVWAFMVAHRRLYGHASDTDPIELSALRVARVRSWHSELSLVRRQGPPRAASRRPVYFAEHGWVDCSVLDRAGLVPGERTAGPVVLEDRESTTVVPPGSSVVLDDQCLRIEVVAA